MTAPRLPVTVLPAATLARVRPELQLLLGRTGQTVHIAGDHDRAACGRRPRGARPVDPDVAVPALRVCGGCRATLGDLVLTHLATVARPTPGELAAVHEARARAIARACADMLEAVREDAVFDGSVSELVHLVTAVPNVRGPEHRVETLTFGGHTAKAVPMTLGLLVGALKPGARTDGRVWITDPPAEGTPVGLPQGEIGDVVALAPAAPGRFPVYTWPQVAQRLGGGRR